MNPTRRQRQILDMLADDPGLTNQEIAALLGIHRVSVARSLEGACNRLNARNRTDAIVRWKLERDGLVAH